MNQWWKLVADSRAPDMWIPGYLERWELARTPKDERVYLHHIIGPDRRVWHDHPWAFRADILQGGYVVARALEKGVALNRSVTSTHCCPATHGHGSSFYHMGERGFHYIKELMHGECWSLVTTGPRLKSWGFFAEGRYWPYQEYLDAHPEHPHAHFRPGYSPGE